ncbi:MAG TPA: metallopeptidase TldD-related protein [Verrucomicrobiae bacterium]|nr:metallopeptidase TldD-related protein [Verrucomicrobiae bacterium]
MTRASLRFAAWVLAILISVPFSALSSPPAPNPLLEMMQGELRRATASLAKSDPAPYFLSYSVVDGDSVTIGAENGALLASTGGRRRQADVMMRVGTAALDNTHGPSRPSGIVWAAMPLADDADASARILWQLTNREYEQASGAFLRVKANTAVRSEEEDRSPDFSQENPQKFVDGSLPALSLNQKMWEDRLRRVSAVFLKYPQAYTSLVLLQAGTTRSYLATSEGTALVEPSSIARLIIEAETRSEDGMELPRVETFQAASPDQLPSEAELIEKADKIGKDLQALRAAPTAEPYVGPALLSGRAAAVFFHEVLGHRLEGHRQRDEREGQTFTKKVNQQVLPSFLTVVDDPTMSQMDGVELAGHYEFDDEGVPAQRVVAVENGVLKNFLMSRMPITNFSHSNGHGRRQAGLMPTGRQGNLIVSSTNTVKEPELRKRFIDEIKKQGKPYGLYFEDIQGGFTLTTRALPQAFQVIPVMVWRVYPDGRPDELVRGVDIVGTPLLSLNNIILTGDTLQVFNGVCGAESGQVPVAAAAPAMLFSEIEVQKRAKSTQRPPILTPPAGSQPPPNGTRPRNRQDNAP